MWVGVGGQAIVCRFKAHAPSGLGGVGGVVIHDRLRRHLAVQDVRAEAPPRAWSWEDNRSLVTIGVRSSERTCLGPWDWLSGCGL